MRRIFPPQLFSLLSSNSFSLLYIGSLKQMSGFSRIMCFSLFDWRLWFKTFRKVHIHSSHFHFPKSTGESTELSYLNSHMLVACWKHNTLETQYLSPWCSPAGHLLLVISCFPVNSVSRNIINDNSFSNWTGNEIINQFTVKKITST